MFISKQEAVFTKEIMTCLNDELSSSSYFSGGNSISLADIQYYCEISTLLYLLKTEIKKSDHPKLYEWFYQSMQVKHPDLVQFDQMFIDALKNL